jgi:hypothetical protein
VARYVQTLAELRQALGSLPLHGQCPAAHERSHRYHQRHLLCGGHGDRRCSALGDHLPLPAQLMQEGRPVQPPRQSIRVFQVLRQRQRLVDPRQGLIWRAQEPQGTRGKDQTPYSRVKIPVGFPVSLEK